LLCKCLDTLLKQTYPACEIIVGRREGDIESAKVLAQYKKRSGGLVRDAVVGCNDNLVASMNAALALSTGSLVALTDDDAEFPCDWLERMVTLFSDPSVGGAGGKDIQVANPGEAATVGLLQWFGRIIGNHHLGIGPVRDVDVLKGVNCCFRGDDLRAIGFDRRLRGIGNVSNWELAVCFAFARRGFRLVFDPSLEIIHHTGPRFDDDTNNRGVFNGASHADSVYNETLLVMEHLSWSRRSAFIAWAMLFGTGATPGLLQLPRVFARQRSLASSLARFWFTMQGRVAALSCISPLTPTHATPDLDPKFH
jgi:GT2 family glycosyltransferase